MLDGLPLKTQQRKRERAKDKEYEQPAHPEIAFGEELRIQRRWVAQREQPAEQLEFVAIKPQRSGPEPSRGCKQKQRGNSAEPSSQRLSMAAHDYPGDE